MVASRGIGEKAEGEDLLCFFFFFSQIKTWLADQQPLLLLSGLRSLVTCKSIVPGHRLGCWRWREGLALRAGWKGVAGCGQVGLAA